jgi:hypothetical protein
MSQYNISLQPILPIYFILVFFFIFLILIFYYFKKRGVAPYFRLIIGLLFLTVLLNPVFIKEIRKSQRSIVAVVLDNSDSQKIGDRSIQSEKAFNEIKNKLSTFDDLDIITVSVDHNNNFDGTSAFEPLKTALKAYSPERIAGVILITDGLIHDIPRNNQLFEINAPIHALITGNLHERDRWVEVIDWPRYGIVGKDQIIKLKVHDSINSKEPSSIILTHDGVKSDPFAIIPGEDVSLPIKISHAGPNNIQLEIPILSDEISASNNFYTSSIDGIRDNLKVLLVSGEPHPGERLWRNLLRSDPNVELTHFTILRNPNKFDATPSSELSLIAFPTDELFGEKINNFDLIIFDRYSNQTYLPSQYFNNIQKYITNGGAFLAVVGPDYATETGIYSSPLSSILPAKPIKSITEQVFQPVISDIGFRHPVTQSLFKNTTQSPDWGRWGRVIDAEVIKGHSIMNAMTNKPLLVLSREGKGRVALLLSDQIWLWARGFDGGGPHLELTRRLAHWLMKEPELEEEKLTAALNSNKIVVTRQSITDHPLTIKVISPSDHQEDVTLTSMRPGVWEYSFLPKESGLWRFFSDNLTASIYIGPTNKKELENIVSTPEHLRSFLEATGGSVKRLASTSNNISTPRIVELSETRKYSGGDWIGIKKTRASTLIGQTSQPIFDGIIALILFITMLFLTWFMEGNRHRLYNIFKS